ncbi:hypothetical protein [Vibrio bivalvicida]|uniref:Uncharacterized protein n=1 Tax=Vibrio bivalvicida TaxID=1276888 RepID=A0ABV4MQC8_9VIBR
MSQLVVIQSKYGDIKGCWSNDGLNFNFDGALFENEKQVFAVNFSVPYSFIKKYGQQTVLDEIRESVEGYIETAPQNGKDT